MMLAPRTKATHGRALLLAWRAIEQAQAGEPIALEVDVPPRPLLADLLDEGALSRALVLLERDGDHGRIMILPRRSNGTLKLAELLEADHARLDAIADRMCESVRVDPMRAVVLAHLFSFGMRRHVTAEEAILFPACQARLGGPPQYMKVLQHEHRATLLYTDRLLFCAERVRSRSDRDEATEDLLRTRRALGGVIAEHNEKEERLVFPLLDRTMREAERRVLLRKLVLF